MLIFVILGIELPGLALFASLPLQLEDVCIEKKGKKNKSGTFLTVWNSLNIIQHANFFSGIIEQKLNAEIPACATLG